MRLLYTRTCPCGQRFTTGDADSVYHSKSCGAKYRAARDGMPTNHAGASIESLKTFRFAAWDVTKHGTGPLLGDY